VPAALAAPTAHTGGDSLLSSVVVDNPQTRRVEVPNWVQQSIHAEEPTPMHKKFQWGADGDSFHREPAGPDLRKKCSEDSLACKNHGMTRSQYYSWSFWM